MPRMTMLNTHDLKRLADTILDNATYDEDMPGPNAMCRYCQAIGRHDDECITHVARLYASARKRTST